ncbi:hypothetical protein ACOJBM_26975 [Rhizobium beringeri]
MLMPDQQTAIGENCASIWEVSGTILMTRPMAVATINAAIQARLYPSNPIASLPLPFGVTLNGLPKGRTTLEITVGNIRNVEKAPTALDTTGKYRVGVIQSIKGNRPSATAPDGRYSPQRW